ncbi:hypothetical protein [Rhodococcus sp. NPDC047139]|uniref:hypothetical protein n=1 Tax=Rhodococcus sp. NPDC047139 TaxID=3155141 RepID=UPI0033D31188
MVNGGPQRVEVRLAVEYPGAGANAPGDGAMRPVDPIPPVCPRHGEPESDRVRVTVAADASEPRRGANRIGSALEAAYTVQVAAVDWPVCGKCVAVRTRWQLAAAATCTVLGVIFLALVFALVQGAPKIYGLALLSVFGLSFLPIFVALRVLEPRRASVGVSVAEDGSELVISRAHPEFARAVEAQRI